MKRELPVWRSLIYVPVSVEKYVDKVRTRGVDVIQPDLEDNVPAAETVKARTLVAKAAARVRRGSFALDGKMIDIPIVVRAQNLIRRYEAVKERESKTLAAVKG